MKRLSLFFEWLDITIRNQPLFYIYNQDEIQILWIFHLYSFPKHFQLWYSDYLCRLYIGVFVIGVSIDLPRMLE